jgi:hypothetical protein
MVMDDRITPLEGPGGDESAWKSGPSAMSIVIAVPDGVT